MRTTYWLSSIVVAGAAWMISACGNASPTDLGPYDPGSDPGSVSGGGGSEDGGASTSGNGTGGGGGGTSSSDAGSGGSGGGGGGSDAGGVAVDAFTGAGPYVATLGPSTLKSGHQNKFGTTDPAGHDCLQCHGFAFGGTVYSSATGTTPVSSAEVRVVDATGKAYSAYSDANGNFYFSATSGFAAPAKVGVRDGSNTALMIGTINTGACNGCHTGSSTARVHLP